VRLNSNNMSLFLFLFYPLLIYYCYATDEQNKCTCKVDEKSLCSICLNDFCLYSQNMDQSDALDVFYEPIQHESTNIYLCENCEENTIKLYLM